jgi:hypothetical protein
MFGEIIANKSKDLDSKNYLTLDNSLNSSRTRSKMMSLESSMCASDDLSMSKSCSKNHMYSP